MSKGMSHFVLVVYSNALASLILLPAAFFFTRITFMQNYVIIVVRYNSPTLASALANLIPTFTFLLGVIFRFVSATMPFVFAAVLKGYPSEIMLVSFYCLFGTIQSALVTLL
ncbi:hypothetical protein Goari_026152, partial [Gossypium aridum]|nr:hypothetical protein [Gossypium aridum]